MKSTIRNTAMLLSACMLGALSTLTPAMGNGEVPNGTCNNGATNPPDCNAFPPTPTAVPQPPTVVPPPPPSNNRSNVIITKWASKSTANIGDQVSFTISVLCEGNTECGQVRVDDAVPAAFKVDGASAWSGQVSVNGQNVSWSQNLMQQREVVNISVNATVVGSGCACNVAQGYAAAPDNPNDNRSEACICVVAQPTPVPAPQPAPYVPPPPPPPAPYYPPPPPPVKLPSTGATALPIDGLAMMLVGLGSAATGLFIRRRK